MWKTSLRKQPTFRDPNTGFPAKWRLRNKRRNSMLMTCHYPDLGIASDWLKKISYAAGPVRSTTQIWVATRHQNSISVLVFHTSFHGETSGGVAKWWLFSQATRETGRETISHDVYTPSWETLLFGCFFMLFLLVDKYQLTNLLGMPLEWRNSKNALLIFFPNILFSWL